MTTDQAGLAFLSLLERITLQDLAILQPDYPGLPFFFSLPSSSDKSGSTSRPSCVQHTGATRSHGVSCWSAPCQSSTPPSAPASRPRSGGQRPRSRP